MQPGAKKADLLYITYPNSGSVGVYSYPGLQAVGALNAFIEPTSECADKAGNVYIVDGSNHVVDEYAHGGTSPIATFTVPLSGEASSCSVDQTTGNLAATAFSVGSDGPLVLVYQKGEYQYPQSYEDASIFSFFSCSYDNNGNLYADGNSTGENYLLTELPHGGSALQSLSLDPSDDLTQAGPIGWDGKFLALGDSGTDVIYRVAISPSGTAYIVGSTTLNGSLPVSQFWIQGKRIIGPDFSENLTFLWHYPAGGSPAKYISGGYGPYGATVSLAAK
jgi:hypothetical protein